MLTALHCFGAYLRTTENWAFRLIRHQRSTNLIIATPRFLSNAFYTPEMEVLRWWVQPRLAEKSLHSIGPHRLVTAAVNLVYPTYLQYRLRKRRIDIVHSHFGNIGWKYRKLAQRLRAKHVVSFYGSDYQKLATNQPVWGHRLRELYARADCFVCEGPHGVDLLVQNGCPREKIRVCRLGVEPSTIQIPLRNKVAGRLRLLQIASFREKKGHLDTVRAFGDALKLCPDMHLTLIGATAGQIYDGIQAEIQARGISNQVTLLPGVDFAQLHAVMHLHDVFIHPSRHAADGDCEGGAPVVLLDAQATGMPIISTRHCDIPQMVMDGVTGTLCAEGDIPAITQAIIEFCEMGQERYASIALAARKHVEDHFDASECAASLELIYRELVEG